MNRIKIYIDENVNIAISEGLKRRGIEAFSAKESRNLGLSDEEHLKYAAKYMEIIPRKHATTRLATLLPCMIGLETLRFLKEDPNLLDPTLPHKISRKTLKRVVITSCFLTFSHKLIQNSLK